jgi:hypothetical protein
VASNQLTGLAAKGSTSQLSSAWDNATVMQRRQLLYAALAAVHVRRAAHPGGTFNPTRLTYHWTDEPASRPNPSTAER